MFGSVVEAIAHHAEHMGKKTALIAEDISVSYGELWLGIQKRAMTLLKKGIQKQDKVILAADHTEQFVETYFAVHWLGAVNVVVERTASMRSISQLVQELSPKVILLNRIEAGEGSYETSAEAGQAALKGDFSTDSLADILYTTGTTGVPKGVMLSHRNEVAGAHNVINGGEMAQDDVNLLTMPLHHAFGLTTLRAVLYHGGTAVLQDGVASLKKTSENIKTNHCNCIYMVPAALRVLYFQTRQRLDLLLADIEKIEFCTAPLDKKMRNVLTDQLGGVRLYNSYGATESARSVYMRLDQNTDKVDAVGQAVQDVLICIVDEERKEIVSSRQNVGHLAVSGDMNMMGYYGAPEMTEGVLNKGVFYSEDLGYMDQEGYIYLVGRNNDVINIGGEKVSPFEIENTALEYDAVQECACIGVEDPKGVLGYVPVLYIAVEEGYTMDVIELQNYLEKQLEHYKIPHEIIVVDAIPKNHIGKIDRKALKKSWELQEVEAG